MTTLEDLYALAESILPDVQPSDENFEILENLGELIDKALKKAYVKPHYKITDFGESITWVKRLGIEKMSKKIGYDKDYVTEKIVEYIDTQKKFVAILRDSFGFASGFGEEDGDKDEDEDEDEDVEAKAEAEAEAEANDKLKTDIWLREKRDQRRIDRLKEKDRKVSIDNERLWVIKLLEKEFEANGEVAYSIDVENTVRWYLKLILSLEAMVEQQPPPQPQQQQHKNKNKKKKKKGNNGNNNNNGGEQQQQN